MVLLLDSLQEPLEEGFVTVIPTLEMRKQAQRSPHDWPVVEADCSSMPSSWPHCGKAVPGSCSICQLRKTGVGQNLRWVANSGAGGTVSSRSICTTRMLRCLWPLRASRGVWHPQSQTLAWPYVDWSLPQREGPSCSSAPSLLLLFLILFLDIHQEKPSGGSLRIKGVTIPGRG